MMFLEVQKQYKEKKRLSDTIPTNLSEINLSMRFDSNFFKAFYLKSKLID